MRRVVLFLLIFGAGFAVLWMLRTKPAHHDDHGGNEAPPKPGQFTELEAPSTKSAHQKIGITLSGSASFIQYKDAGGKLRPEIEVTSKHLEAVSEDVYDMHDLVVHLFDPATQKKRADLVSPKSAVKLTLVDDQPRLSQTEPVHLTNVDMTLFEGGPVVPLHLEVPALDWTIGAESKGAESFESNDRVQVHGNGLEATGTGLIAKMSDSSLQLKHDAEIVFDLENGHQVTLGSGLTGPIVISKVLVDGIDHVDVIASEGARFEVSGDNPVNIRAQTIHMVGRKSPTNANGYAIVSADARGAVHATSRGDRFDAEKADFTFSNGGLLEKAILDEHVVLSGGPDTFAADHAEFEFEQKAGGAQGALTKATLTGSPTGTIELGRFLPPERVELQNVHGHLSGAGPLVMTREDGDHVDFKGPAKLEMPDVGITLSAQSRIFGHDDASKKSGSLTAEGTSVLVYEKNDIHCDSLDLNWNTDAADLTKLDITTHGVTTLNGITEAGEAVTLIAVGGLDATSIEKKLTITQARDVEIVSTDHGVTGGHADLLDKFEWNARSLSASGNVSFHNADGEGSGQRISVVSRDEVHLYGSPSSPARFRFLAPKAKPGAEAGISGNEIVVTPGAASADGAAQARVQNADNRLDLECKHLDIRSSPPDPATPDAPRDFHVHATGEVKSHWKRSVPVVENNPLAPGVESTADVDCEDLVVDGTAQPNPVQGENPTVATTNVVARTAVHVEYHGTSEMTGDGDLFTLDEKGLGRLSADAGKVVHARGHLVGTALPYTLDADWIEFDSEHITVSKVRLKMDESAKAVDAAFLRDAQTPEQAGPGASTAVLGEVRADTMRADKHEIFLDGSAHVEGITGQGEAWSIDAGSIRMQGDFSQARSLRTDQITSLETRGGFHAQLGDRLEARGDRLDGTPKHVSIEGTPARLMMLDAEWQSARIDYEMTNMLLSTDPGSMRSRVGSPGPSWSLDYESMQPFDRDDRTILVLRNPRLRTGSKQLFADWMLFWVDRNEWRKSGTHTMSEAVNGTELRVNEPNQNVERNPHAPVTSGTQQNPLTLPAQLLEIQSSPVFRVLSEVYIEGNVEIFEQGEREARASAIYLDIIETQGWIRDGDVSIVTDVRGFKRRIRARANWMRISPEPALRADKAEITACDFDTPHYVIETSDLRIRPKSNSNDQRVAYDVSARGNRIRFENGLRLPLPPLVFESDQEGNPLIDRFVLGNSAKYGAAVSATVNAELGPVGQATGKALAHILRFPETDIRGNWHYNVGILGSRGVLFGPGITLRAGNQFLLEMEYDVIPDRGSDIGLVPVDKDDRSLFRTWFHARARYTVADGEWFDLAVSHQSDAGIQSEFFERQYLRYEEKDTYLHWRKAKDEWYFNASAKALTEDRTDTAELPSAGAYLGRKRIAEAFDNPVYYTGRVDAGYYKRNDGDARYYAPFEDGLGSRELTRIDTEHRVEMPFALGFLDARGTPYVDARGTVWSEGADPSNSPSRAALIVGFDAATTFWKRFSNGAIHTITPSVGVHGDVASEENGGGLVHIDQTEDPITGRYVDVGLRTRWWLPDTLEHLDLDVRVSDGSNLPDGQHSGLQPVAVLGDFLTYVKGIPIAMTQDGRYDLRTGNTVYSLTSLGLEPLDNVGLEFGYQRGLSSDQQTRLFESASIAMRYSISPKWEVEFGQSYAIAAGTGVGNSATLRRLGHDFVTEIGAGYRSGEGSTFTISFEPRITWKRSGLGLLDRELSVYH